MRTDLEERVKDIIDCINDETADLNGNERAMVVLLVKELIKCSVELDIIDTFRPKKGE